jgi:hypothetical protein
MIPFLCDGVPFPTYPTPGFELTYFERMFGFVVLYVVLLSIISLLLPRFWFAALFRLAFPFLPERLEKDHA